MAKSVRKPMGLIFSVVAIVILAGGVFGAWQFGFLDFLKPVEIVELDPETICPEVSIEVNSNRRIPDFCYDAELSKFTCALKNTGESINIVGVDFEVVSVNDTVSFYSSTIDLTVADFKRYFVPYDSESNGEAMRLDIFPRITNPNTGEDYVCRSSVFSYDAIVPCE